MRDFYWIGAMCMKIMKFFERKLLKLTYSRIMILLHLLPLHHVHDMYMYNYYLCIVSRECVGHCCQFLHPVSDAQPTWYSVPRHVSNACQTCWHYWRHAHSSSSGIVWCQSYDMIVHSIYIYCIIYVLFFCRLISVYHDVLLWCAWLSLAIVLV